MRTTTKNAGELLASAEYAPLDRNRLNKAAGRNPWNYERGEWVSKPRPQPWQGCAPVFTYPPPRKVERPAEPRPVGDAEVGRSIVGYPAPGSHSVLVRRPPKKGKPINTKCQTVHKLSTIRTPNRLRCIGPCARQFYPQTRSLTGILPSSGRIASVPRAFLWYIRTASGGKSRSKLLRAPGPCVVTENRSG